MAVLRSIESKIEGLFEGVFGRAFRTHVQPIELARKLVKEMDDHRNVSVSKVYVPNEYTLYLSPDDRRQFDGYEQALVGELQEYLAEHARRETYVLLSSPRVLMHTDSDLEVGEFGIATRMVQPEPGEAEPQPLPEAPPAGATMVYKPQSPPTQAATPEELGVLPQIVTLDITSVLPTVAPDSTLRPQPRASTVPRRSMSWVPLIVLWAVAIVLLLPLHRWWRRPVEPRWACTRSSRHAVRRGWRRIGSPRSSSTSTSGSPPTTGAPCSVG